MNDDNISSYLQEKQEVLNAYMLVNPILKICTVEE